MSEDNFPLSGIAAGLMELGAVDVLVKHLAPNDNSKNQIYLAGDISALGLLPTGVVEFNAGTSQKVGAEKRGPIFRAAIDLWWLGPEQKLEKAPKAKLILYPQYSEVRLSGFLRGCSLAPAELFDIQKRGREPGRVLLLAPLLDGRVVAATFVGDSVEAAALRSAGGEPYGVLQRFKIRGKAAELSSEELLLRQLRRIHLLGWLDPVYLDKNGLFRPCRGSNCGGVTLESHLGVTPNGFSEPDFEGWEVKQHNVGSWTHPKSGRVTLMTPEPSGGAYVDKGPEWFIRKWGYADQMGREDRLNFGGVYRVGANANERTRLRLVLSGYDEPTGRFDGDGSVMLVDPNDTIAAAWSFSKLIDHWKRKHARAAFVPSICNRIPTIQYQYGASVALAEGAKFNLLLRGFACGKVHYDPGIKLEGTSSAKPKLKRRSQFRVDTSSLEHLYAKFRQVNLIGP